ncbi:signal recognition particle-docking protein FtsY [Alicyclobacillus cycloheptanicus]|uniref:Signal recognition particle receptor FtsY n=1 Tax=Alicyclobacillus cycloheptanicus TaxID=1457 RepID=A0ABT9XMI8_9BACL|nr:signal recognition particle-docking protein FtsY [Alicyclobacillus cycloheptanicus]MDQ0191530.1 fused signal recognition particle receptor [Alicyclobacillus cycloheptanicus]WDM01435.1 signal recognition particle-docking protein FtsY [Alicyclobacillus cycloheptanicus]
MGLFDKFRKGLEKSRTGLWGRLGGWIQGGKIDDTVYDEMEEALLAADVGFDTAIWLVEQVRRAQRQNRVTDPKELPRLLMDAMVDALSGPDPQMHFAESGPTLMLVVGVNGVGKTTSIAKLAHYYQQQGKKVILAAGDTFRAAAIEQLTEWGGRIGCDVVRHSQGADPAAVVFDAISAARSRNADLILCDTAGRLHNKANLMNELAKIHKVAERELPGSPHEVLLVLDAVTGQNALSQAKVFQEVVNVSGIVVTKLDGTAKGGVVLPIVRERQIAVKWVGLGEQMDDLEPFDARAFAQAICSYADEAE